ncbi:hypothetical protein ACFV9D_24845 [Streptomyces sp. NPDC059875]|uniref:hypothetical protein n=1 Tax=unclassified Streptomyces TaxID=2593676 RepID=UPI00365E8D89
MDTATIIATIGVVFIAKVCAVLAVWLRHRGRVQQEKVQRQYVLGLAAAAPAGAQVELDDQRHDGRLRLRITQRPDDQAETAA